MFEASIVDVAHNAQGGCSSCATQTGPFVLVPSFRDEVGQAVYFCQRCLGVMADAFGFVRPETLAAREVELGELLEQQQSQIRALTAEKEQALRDTYALADAIADRIGERLDVKAA